MAIVAFFIFTARVAEIRWWQLHSNPHWKGRLYAKGRGSISMEIWDLLNKGFGFVRESMGGALVRSEQVLVETRQAVNGGMVSAWRMWDSFNQALAETAVPDGRRPALIRLQLDDKSEAVLPFMAQVPFGASTAYAAKRAERASRIMSMRKAQ